LGGTALMQSIAFQAAPSPREEGIALVDHGSSHPHNLGTTRVRSYTLSGIGVHCVQQDALPGRSWHQLSNRHPMLAIVVNEAGGLSETRPSLHGGVNRLNQRRQRRNGYTSLIPAGLPIWCYSDQIARVDAVRLVLDVDRVFEVMGGDDQIAGLAEPRLTFFDENLQSLGRLIASSQDEISSFHLFGDSVVAAIVARILHLCTTNHSASSRRLGLTKRQLTQVTEFMHDNLSRSIRLSELASLAGLSASQFGRAFKVSTGMTPHKWHLAVRIEYAKRMLGDRQNSLVDIALEAGFCEQSHFTRAFTAANGISPHAWRRSRLD
jgi:AraC family transcriptional regulator